MSLFYICSSVWNACDAACSLKEYLGTLNLRTQNLEAHVQTAAATKFLVLEHLDANAIMYKHKPVAVEIKGSIMSHEAISKIPRFQKRWIKSRAQTELQQVVHYAEAQPVPHWSMGQHEHRQELTRIIHEATEGVSATKVKPMKPYVTDAILEVSSYRARLIRTKHREEQQVRRLDRKRIFAVWKEVTHWTAGHKCPTDVPLSSFGAFHF